MPATSKLPGAPVSSNVLASMLESRVSIKPGDPKNDGITLGQTYQKMRNTYDPLDKESTNNVFFFHVFFHICMFTGEYSSTKYIGVSSSN
jgi:hypothetical protein